MYVTIKKSITKQNHLFLHFIRSYCGILCGKTTTMDNLSDQMGLLSDDFIEECSEDSDDHHNSKNIPLREQDRFLPIANIAKIMKRAIPENGKVNIYLVFGLSCVI